MKSIHYNIYEKVRSIVWETLIKSNVERLPVDIVKVVCDNNITLLKDGAVNMLCMGEHGATLFDGLRWFIIYDEALPLAQKRFTIAHELGHVFLRHPLTAGFHVREIAGELPPTETEANIFASRFLAPSCVLWALGLRSPADIMSVCGISMESAEIRAARMAELYRRGRFLSSPLELRVYEQFRGYIEKSRP